MVSTQYPPVHGGIGHYTYNLVKTLWLNELDVTLVSDTYGSGDYGGRKLF
jgi:hypothetical protein